MFESEDMEMELAIMIEGQNGLTWQKLERIAQAVEGLGYAALYRSDHITNSQPPDQPSLDCWVSLAWLATNTRRIQFGPLVSPISMHHPVNIARMARDIDDLSGGRLQLGLGAGWLEREHHNYSFDLLELKGRFNRFREALEIITKLFRSEKPLTFTGEYYRLEDAVLLPRPLRPGGPHLLIGGRGPNRTPQLVADFADEWNIYRVSPQTVAELTGRLTYILQEQGRSIQEIRRSMMVNIILGKDDADLREKMAGKTLEDWREKGLVGTPAQIVDQIGEYAALGIQRLILQQFCLDDLSTIEEVAARIMPRL